MSDTSTPKNTPSTQDEVGFRESMKLFFDFFKHGTTLSTGTILLVTTVAKSVEQNRFDELAPCLRVGVILLLASVLTSLICMLLTAMNIKHELSEKEKGAFSVAAMIAILTFVLGIGASAYFISFASVPAGPP